MLSGILSDVNKNPRHILHICLYTGRMSSYGDWHLFVYSPDIYCCGLLSTRKSDCTGLPQSMLVCGSTPAQRGQSRVMMKGSMSLISWYNKGHFRFLTNSYSPTKQGKWCWKAKTRIVLLNYKYFKMLDNDGKLYTQYALKPLIDVFIVVGKCKSLWANLTVFQ